MEIQRCGHFSLEVQTMLVSEAGILIRIPVRRCALAECLIGHLATSEEGREIARKISIADSLATVAASSQDNEAEFSAARAAFGPDLEVVNAAECTAPRCRESCTPGFQSFLRHFGHADIADKETGQGCADSTLSGRE